MACWTARDPIGEAGGLNLYAFVGNNPVNWVDPWGLAIRSPGAENAAQALAEMHGRLRGYVNFLPSWLLDMLLPVSPQGIFDDALTGLMCPLSAKQVPMQLHHYATNKSKKFTPLFKKIVKKFGLDLDDV